RRREAELRADADRLPQKDERDDAAERPGCPAQDGRNERALLLPAREGLGRLVGERSRIEKAHGTPLFLEAGTQFERAVVAVLVGAIPHVAARYPELQSAELHRREMRADARLVVVIVAEHGELGPEIAEPEHRVAGT